MGQRRGDEVPGFFTAGQAGELPLFYVTSPKLSRSRAVGRNRRIDASTPLELPQASSHVTRRVEVGADIHLGEGDVGSSSYTHSQEIIATWASSYRFDLDSQDAAKLQAMLERDARSSGRNLTTSHYWSESPGGSFRFRNQTEEEEKPCGLNLTTEAILGSNRFVANGTGSEKRRGCGEAAMQSSGRSWDDVVPIEAPRSVAVDVPNSPERDEVLRRLEELKAANPRAGPSLLRFSSPSVDDVVTKSAARRDHLHQRFRMTDSSSTTSRSSSTAAVSSKSMMAPSQAPQEITTTTLGELDIMPLGIERIRLHSNSPSPSGAQSAQERYPIAPTTKLQSPRRSSSCSSTQDSIATIRRLQFPAPAASCNVSKFPSPDHTPFLSAARGSIPFKWEEEPGKPKIITLNALRLSPKEEAKGSNFGSEKIVQSGKSTSQEVDDKIVTVEVNGTSSGRSCSLDGAGVESHRYYGAKSAHMRGHSASSSLERSMSRRYESRRETQIDLAASAAAKFLVELYDTPLSTPGRHSSSLVFAVPFKWEDAPGKAKVETQEERRRASMLQLPPRLAVPSCRSVEGLISRGSHPGFAALFAPCLTASTSPGHQHHDLHEHRSDHRGLDVQYGSSKSLPSRDPNSPNPPRERRKRTGLVGRCYSSPQEGCQIRVSSKSPVSQSASRDLLTEEAGSPWLKKSISSRDAAPSSPRSILCGPGDGSSSSQTSASNVNFSSGDLEAFTQQTNHELEQSASKSSTSNNSSFESIEGDFAELPSPAEKLQCPDQSAANWSPALDNYIQSLEAEATPTSTSASTGASPASGEVNSCKGELPLPGTQTMLQQQELNSSAGPAESTSSPRRPTRLPYTMPSLEDQLLACGEKSTRRELSPRAPRRSSGRRRKVRSINGRTWGGTTTRAPPRVERYHADEVCHTSPAYAAALQLLSPPVSIVTQRQRKGLALPFTKPRRRARFMMSICKSLKRLVLGKQRRCKAIEQFEPKLMYDYSISPTTFQFYQPN